jgi:hypothetical protein
MRWNSVEGNLHWCTIFVSDNSRATKQFPTYCWSWWYWYCSEFLSAYYRLLKKHWTPGTDAVQAAPFAPKAGLLRMGYFTLACASFFNKEQEQLPYLLHRVIMRQKWTTEWILMWYKIYDIVWQCHRTQCLLSMNANILSYMSICFAY